MVHPKRKRNWSRGSLGEQAALHYTYTHTVHTLSLLLSRLPICHARRRRGTERVRKGSHVKRHATWTREIKDSDEPKCKVTTGYDRVSKEGLLRVTYRRITSELLGYVAETWVEWKSPVRKENEDGHSGNFSNFSLIGWISRQSHSSIIGDKSLPMNVYRKRISIICRQSTPPPVALQGVHVVYSKKKRHAGNTSI